MTKILSNWADPVHYETEVDEKTGELKIKVDKDGKKVKKITGKVNTLPSMTVPDDALSIKELIDKHLMPKQLPTPNNNDPELFQLKQMDKIDQIEYVRAANKKAVERITNYRAAKDAARNSKVEPTTQDITTQKTKGVSETPREDKSDD